MNILFDLTAVQPNSSGRFHGGGKYAKQIFLQIIKTCASKTNITSYVYFDSNKEMDPEIEDKFYLIEGFVDRTENNLLLKINEYQIDVFYSALPYHLKIKDISAFKCKFVGTIHGLRELEIPPPINSLAYCGFQEKIKTFLKIIFSTLYYKKHWNRYYTLIQNKNSCFIAVSNHTRASILTFFPELSFNDIPVFYSPDVSNIIISSPQRVLTGNYFLLVSGNRWIKNNLMACEAFDKFFDDNPNMDYKVVVTGVTDKQIYERKLKNIGRFDFLDYVDEKKLHELYQGAFCFIYLSLNEGFGYPPLEAMKYSVPVIASPCTSIPEVCGDSVLYANPFSKTEIINRISQIVYDKKTYKNLQKKGLARYSLIKKRQDEDIDKMVEFITERNT